MSMRLKSRWTYLIILFLSCFSSWMVSAQSHWSSKFLKNVYSQSSVKTDSMILSQLSTEKYRSPIIRDVDLRLRSSQITPEIEEFRMRFDLMNPAMITADKNYQIALQNYQEVRSKVRINEFLLERYHLLIGHYHRSRMIADREKLLYQYQGLLENSDAISVRDALKLDREILHLSREEEELRLKQSFLEEELKQELPGYEFEFTWDQFQFVTEEQIMEQLEYVMGVQMQEAELIISRDVLAKEELARDGKQSKRSLGFIQPEYEVDPANDIADNLRFQVGIQLPIFDEDRVERKLKELKLLADLADSENDAQALQKLISQIWLSAQFFKQDIALMAAKSDQLKKFSDELVATDLKLFIDVLSYQNEINELELRSKMDLLRIYVQAMSLSGGLARPPLHNFLMFN